MSASVVRLRDRAVDEFARRAERSALALASDPVVYQEAIAAGLNVADFGSATHQRAFRQIQDSYAKEPELAYPLEILRQADINLEDELVIVGSQPVETIVAQLAGYRREREAGEYELRAAEVLQRTPRDDGERAQNRELARAHLDRADELARGEPWPIPVAWNDPAASRPFPVSSFPPWLSRFIEDEASATQTPADLAAMLVLAALSTCLQGKLRVQIRGDWSEPLNLFVLVALPPGNRKSAVFRDVMEPIEEYSCELADEMAPAIARARSTQRIALQRLTTAEKAAARAIDAVARVEAEQTAHEAADALRLAEAAIPAPPLLMCSDITPQAIPLKLAEGGGALTIASAEGIGIVDIVLGRYSDGAVAAAEVLSGHAGDKIQVDRVGRPTVVVRNPALTMALTCQPDVLRQLGERRETRGLGLLARFLYSVPISTVGYRLSSPPPMRNGVLGSYFTNMRALLALQQQSDREPLTLIMSSEGRDALLELADRLEPRMAPGGDLEHVADWACKLTGAVARIAALLHAAENAGLLWPAEIGEETVQRAIAVGEYLLEHAVAVLSSIGADPSATGADTIMRWLMAKGHRQITRRDLYRGVRARFKTSQDLDPVLAHLEEHGWLRTRNVAARGSAKRTVQVIDVNPAAFVDRSRVSERSSSRDRHEGDTSAQACDPPDWEMLGAANGGVG